MYLKNQGINVQIIIPAHPENNGVYIDNERIFFPIDRYKNELNQLKFNYKIKEFKIKKYLYILQEITLWDDTDYG